MAKHIKCGTLFNGLDDDAQTDQSLVIEDAILTYVGPSDKAPQVGAGDEIVDHSDYFVMPGLTDIHTHLSYGNAQCEEDIDLYVSRHSGGVERATTVGGRLHVDGRSGRLCPRADLGS